MILRRPGGLSLSLLSISNFFTKTDEQKSLLNSISFVHGIYRRQVDAAFGERLAKENNAAFVETSAKENINVGL